MRRCGLDRDRWRALVNSILNLRLPWNAGKLSSVQTTRDLWVVLSSMELVTYTVFLHSYTRIRVTITAIFITSVGTTITTPCWATENKYFSTWSVTKEHDAPSACRPYCWPGGRNFQQVEHDSWQLKNNETHLRGLRCLQNWLRVGPAQFTGCRTPLNAKVAVVLCSHEPYIVIIVK
jgi:hypothetical protein